MSIVLAVDLLAILFIYTCLSLPFDGIAPIAALWFLAVLNHLLLLAWGYRLYSWAYDREAKQETGIVKLRKEPSMNTSRLGAHKWSVENITRRWWFFLIVLLLFFLPSFSSRPFDPRDTPQFITAVLSQALAYAFPLVSPVFKIIPILLVAGITLWGDRVTRAFSIYAAVNLLGVAVLANTAITEEYGFAVITGNVVVYLIVGGFWAWEAVVKRSDFSPREIPLWKYWVAPLAFLAFWMPAGPFAGEIGINFDPALIVMNSAGLMLCMMIPVYLAVLTLFYPTVNLTTMRVTAIAAFITGLFNMLQWFGFQPGSWWMGVLHLPMVSISLYAFILSLKRIPQDTGLTPE